LLAAGDLLVVNRTEVLRARLRLQRPSGGRAELLLCRPRDGGVSAARIWEAMGRPASALRPGLRLSAPDGSGLEIVERQGELVLVRGERPLAQLMATHGQVPLPPYIRRPQGPTARDADDYQSLFASEPGAVAAPTASLHFTERVLGALRQRDITVAGVVLHVGPGTFVPVRDAHFHDVRQHPMHAEWYEVPDGTVAAMAGARAEGRRVVAVGTTVVRALETWAATQRQSGDSELFIFPGFEFRAVDALLTNFHLPRSTLLMLVSALAGRERVLAAYAEAIREGYRFFSYGDAMLIA
jgi:S-adenosylmethionine:tRNA ribosyltransferase-isomerase